MRLWSVLLSTVGLLLAGVVPAQADALADGPQVSVAPVGVEPPSYSGVCSPGVRFTVSAAITASGPGTVSYYLQSDYYPFPRQVTFTEAGTKTVTMDTMHYVGVGLQSRTVKVQGANQAEAAVSYQLSCTDPVPGEPQIQPATDYIGRCGSDVVHTINAQISSPIAQTVRYRWRGAYDRPLPGLEDEREIVFTEPGTKTVSAPFQRLPIPGTNGGASVEVQLVSPGSAQHEFLYYRTVCVKAEFTSMMTVAGNCRNGVDFKYKMDGYLESNAIGQMSYAWAHQPLGDDEWLRDPWKPLSFTTDNTPGRQSVSKTWSTPGGVSGAWRLEIAGSDGTVVSQSRPYRACG
ncbi:hypothetical protein ABT061_09575 [Streptosporangium sp. NPDC002544]|uniref:hypothetical protein n=1 Tax=Streptosporangium sp. NPDC002544 TaxID=3154538 RepID=UPI00332CF27E